MAKIAPSEQVRQQLQALLDDGSREAPVSEFIRLAVQRVVQELLEQEVSDDLGRERYERRDEGSRGIATATSQGGYAARKARCACKCRRYARASNPTARS